MIPNGHLHVLRFILDRLRDEQFIWALTGSLALALQGVQVEVHDIDIQSDQEGAEDLENCFSTHVVKPVTFTTGEKIRSYLGELRINGVKVEIMGAIQKRGADGSWDPPTDIRPHIRRIRLEELTVPVLDLHYELRAYRRLGRPQTVELIQHTLDKGTYGKPS